MDTGDRLPDFRRCSDLNEVIRLVKPLIHESKWSLSARDAAIALNIMYKFSRTNDNDVKTQADLKGARDEAGVLSTTLVSHVLERIEELDNRHISMALTATAKRAKEDRLSAALFTSASEVLRSRAQASMLTNRTSDFTARTLSMIAAAYARSTDDVLHQSSHLRLFRTVSMLLKKIPPEHFGTRSLGLLVRSFSQARLLESDEELLNCLCKAILLNPPHKFDVQSCTDILSAFSRSRIEKMIVDNRCHRNEVLKLMTEAAIFILRHRDRESILKSRNLQTTQKVAALLSSFSACNIADPVLLELISEEILSLPTASLDVQSIATFMYCYANLNFRLDDLTSHLTSKLLRIPLRQVSPQAAANIAWSAAVIESEDPALLCWIWRALDTLMKSLTNPGLSQVHQFFLYNNLCLNVTREEVFRAFYGNSNSPREVRSLTHSIEESTHLLCKQAFITESRQLRALTESSRFHSEVIHVLRDIGQNTVEAIFGSRLVQTGAAEACDWILSEHIDERSGYSFDIYIPSCNLVVEVDGPSHFAWRQETEMGGTNLKHEQVRALGYNLVSLPYFHWEPLVHRNVQKAFVIQELQECARRLK
uniref:RAP domain-containing protein n=1 Tax=Guillardia theta TaxID=55529 RepID=A0A7S4JSF5_GUITH|mmetsp:Transcript_18394/g.60395  ORF Transcript_18394/g.60395 Transcript_18394/m.60395 type:complete len:594 (+) Transcript_18394:287-2068(+)